jgi:V8-like Glu-specific endopeptidase
MISAWVNSLSRHVRRLRQQTWPAARRPSTSRTGVSLCLEGLEDRITPSLGAISNTTSYPYRAIVELHVTFPDGTKSVGSGALVDRFHVLTAAHMLYSYKDGGSASSIIVTPGLNGSSSPYGNAKMVWERFYGDPNHPATGGGWVTYNYYHPNQTGAGAADIGLITLDKAIGDLTGWYGMYYDTSTSVSQLNYDYGNLNLNTAGYPAPYDSSGNRVILQNGVWPTGNTLYHDFGRMAGVSSDGSLLEFANGRPQGTGIETHPGQSGSPVWYYDGKSDSSNGIEAVEVCQGGATRITPQMYNAFHNAMSYDATYRPPQSAYAASSQPASGTYSGFQLRAATTADPSITYSGTLGTYLPPSPPSTAPTPSATFTLVSNASSAVPVSVGQPVTFSATVSAATGTPTGIVSFYDDSTFLGAGSLQASSLLPGYASASFTTSSLPAGSHTITASYSGDASHWSSSGTYVQVILAGQGSAPPTSSHPAPVPQPASGPALAVTTTIGTFDPSTATWYLKNHNGPGAPDITAFRYGAPGWIPVVGDWDGDGTTTIGVVDPATETWYLKNSNTPGAPDITAFRYGAPGWIPLVGDWGGTGHTGIGVFDPATATFSLRNEPSGGAPDAGQFRYGAPGWIPVVGDWDGNGTTTVGVVDPSTETWYLRNRNSAGAPDIAPFRFGASGWIPVVGDWDGDGKTTIGVVNPATETWYLRNENSAGASDIAAFAYGAPAWDPLAGDWTGPLGK